MYFVFSQWSQPSNQLLNPADPVLISPGGVIQNPTTIPEISQT